MAQLPRWSSDPNFPAGSQPWNGQPTRVEPLATIKARGFLPGTVPPAGWFNWLLGLLFDESNDQDTRLTAAEARTLQDSYDASVAAGETLPTIQIGSAPITIRGPLLGGEAVVFQARGTSPAVIMQPGSAGEETLRVQNAGAILLQEEGSNNGFSVRAPDVMSGGHGITVPDAANETSKAALVRAPGTGTQATEWAKWEDLDSNPAWSPTPTYGTNVSGMGTVRGTWSQVGKSVSFSANGTVNISSAGQPFTFTIPAPKNAGSTFFGGGGGTVDDGFIDGIVASGGTITISGQPGSTGTSGISWSIHGQYAAA